jgi:hypothetical protein
VDGRRPRDELRTDVEAATCFDPTIGAVIAFHSSTMTVSILISQDELVRD